MRCFLEKFTQLAQILHDRQSRRSRQISTLLPRFLDLFNTFYSKQKFQQAFRSWSKFTLILFGNGGEIQKTTLLNPCDNLNKFI